MVRSRDQATATWPGHSHVTGMAQENGEASPAVQFFANPALTKITDTANICILYDSIYRHISRWTILHVLPLDLIKSVLCE